MSETAEAYAFDELHESGGNCHITLTRQQAIDWQKKTYETRDFTYKSDERALEHFITVHWAYQAS